MSRAASRALAAGEILVPSAVDTDCICMTFFAERHGLALSSSLTELLTDERVEALVLATPRSLYAEQIIASAEARKPVFCGKPLALTPDDDSARCSRLVRTNRFWPNMQAMQRIFASGARGGSSACGATRMRSRRAAG
jgi:predicted dehydrogenase